MTTSTKESPHYVSYTRAEMVQTLVIGAVVGVLVWGLTWVLHKYAFNPLMCESGVASKCSDSYSYSLITGQIIAAVVGLIALAQRRIYRPLLVVLASTATLWGLLSTITNWTWYGILIASVVLYAVAYFVFMLLGRIRNLLLSVVAMVILLVVTRLILNS